MNELQERGGREKEGGEERGGREKERGRKGEREGGRRDRVITVWELDFYFLAHEYIFILYTLKF